MCSEIPAWKLSPSLAWLSGNDAEALRSLWVTFQRILYALQSFGEAIFVESSVNWTESQFEQPHLQRKCGHIIKIYISFTYSICMSCVNENILNIFWPAVHFLCKNVVEYIHTVIPAHWISHSWFFFALWYLSINIYYCNGPFYIQKPSLTIDSVHSIFILSAFLYHTDECSVTSSYLFFSHLLLLCDVSFVLKRWKPEACVFVSMEQKYKKQIYSKKMMKYLYIQKVMMTFQLLKANLSVIEMSIDWQQPHAPEGFWYKGM